MIVNTEIARFGTRGVVDGLLNGGVIAVPPILNYGSPELQAAVLPDLLSGKKFVALAISEAFAGSDVSGLQTTAVQDGDHWVVTGTKKYYNASFCCITSSLTLIQMDNKRDFCRLLHHRMQNRGKPFQAGLRLKFALYNTCILLL